MLHRCLLLFEDLDTAITGGITSTADPTANANGGSDLSLSGLLTSLDFAEGRCITVSIRALGFANRHRLFPQACFRHYQSCRAS
jgi:hypothetical protein